VYAGAPNAGTMVRELLIRLLDPLCIAGFDFT
jgi:hypothetical protein